MQNKIINAHKLLDEQGNLFESGWCDNEILEYNPRYIKLNRMNMKEWDSYIIFSSSGEYALSLIFADKRFTGLISACFYNIKTGVCYECFAPKVLPSGKITLSHSILSGSSVFKDSTTEMMYLVSETQRHLYCKFSPIIGDSIEANIRLSYGSNKSLFSLAVADDEQFCYNQKILGMSADGWVSVNGEKYLFKPETDFAVLDWGRGVRTKDSTRYWCTGASEVEGKRISFNLGYGFFNLSGTTENCVCYDGVCHKLGRIFFDIPYDDITAEWQIRSDDGRFEAQFKPLNVFEIKHTVLKSSHKEKTVFGRMNALIVLDDGTKLSVNDMLCFFEKADNKY